MATTPTKNDDLHAAESHDPESASRHKKIATKSVLTASPSAYLASFSSKLAKAEGGDTAGVSVKPVHSKAEDSGTHKTSGDIAANDSNDVDIFDDDDEEVVQPVRSLRPTPTETSKKVVGSSSKKKTIGKLKLQKRAPIKIKKTPATKKVDAKLNGFWEIERIVDVRKSGSSYEYLVKWKGDYENTWEPQKNLNSSALQEAKELRQEHELRESRASN